MDDFVAVSQAVGRVIGFDLTQVGIIATGLVGVYKFLGRRERKARIRQRNHADFDREFRHRFSDYISEHMTTLRGALYQEVCRRVSEKQSEGYSGIKVHLKSIPVVMSHDVFLEKVDRHCKDAITCDLVKYISRQWDDYEYSKKNEVEREELVNIHSKHLRDILWIRLSKDVGHCEILQQSYDVACSYEEIVDNVKNLVEELVNLEGQRDKKKIEWDRLHKWHGGEE
jgi:hypothetical protein